MMEESSRWCVLLPCSASQAWAVPQKCLAEIVTVQADSEYPPGEITWRGESVPVLDFSDTTDSAWRDSRSGTGLVAVLLGLEGGACRYWGVAVRGEGLGVSEMNEDEMEDLPDSVLEHASAAFRMSGQVYQVPDLGALQDSLGVDSAAAQ